MGDGIGRIANRGSTLMREELAAELVFRAASLPNHGLAATIAFIRTWERAHPEATSVETDALPRLPQGLREPRQE
jgi:hypothetical protein